MTTTVEEHIEGLRAAGETMPNRFIRAGLLHSRQHHHDLGDYYIYEPHEDFEVDDVWYRSMRSPGLMVFSVDTDGSIPCRMNHSRPPTEAELDQWVRSTSGSSWIYEPADS